MTIFKRVYSSYLLLSNKIKNGDKSELSKCKLEALKEVILYFKNLQYIDNPESKLKVAMYIELVKKYDKGIYSKITRELFRAQIKVKRKIEEKSLSGNEKSSDKCKKTKSKVKDVEYTKYLNSVQALICYTSKNLERKFGEAINLIEKGEVEEALVQLRKNSSNKKILKGVLNLLPESKKKETLKVQDCGAGLIFIGCFTDKILRKEIEHLKEQLEYVRYILESPDADYDEKEYVNDFLDNYAGVLPLIESMVINKSQ